MIKAVALFECLLATIVLFSCKNNKKIAETLRKMESKPIELCVNRLPCYINGIDTCGYIPKGYNHLLVVNIDSAECTSCRISHLYQWYEWFELAEDKNMHFSIILIIQPKSDEAFNISNKLRRNSQIYKNIPLYLDINGSFLKKNFNFSIPPTMQTMLLDNNDSIVYVGNPLINNTIKKDITNIINNKKNEKD